MEQRDIMIHISAFVMHKLMGVQLNCTVVFFCMKCWVVFANLRNDPFKHWQFIKE